MTLVALPGRAGLRLRPRAQPLRSPLALTSSMQSTGHTGRHSSQPVHCAAITVCICLARADDAVDRAGLDAQGAADAPGFVDARQPQRAFAAAVGIQRRDAAPVIAASRSMPSAPPGGQRLMAAVAGGNGLGVSAAVGVAAARALGLRQCGVDAIGQWRRPTRRPDRRCRALTVPQGRAVHRSNAGVVAARPLALGAAAACGWR